MEILDYASHKFYGADCSACGGAITITSKDSDSKEITTAFLVAAFAPKAVQGFAEPA